MTLCRPGFFALALVSVAGILAGRASVPASAPPRPEPFATIRDDPAAGRPTRQRGPKDPPRIVRLKNRAEADPAPTGIARCRLDTGDRASVEVVRAFGAITAIDRDEPLFVEVAMESKPKSALASLVDQLGADEPIAAKREASGKLVNAGLEAVPLLVAALADERIYERRIADAQNDGPAATAPPVRMVTITVGMHCSDLLYAMITPAATQPIPRFKVFSQQILKVGDWRAFWASREGRSLDSIRSEMQPLVAAYWAAHGTTQSVPK